MSASDATTTIYLSDTPNQIKNKVKKYAFSGGGETLEEHKEKGANLKVDIPYQFLQFFLEDDAELARIAEEYGSGRMLTSEIKEICSNSIIEFIKEYQERRKNVTDADVELFCAIRPIDPGSSKMPPPPPKEVKTKEPKATEDKAKEGKPKGEKGKGKKGKGEKNKEEKPKEEDLKVEDSKVEDSKVEDCKAEDS